MRRNRSVKIVATVGPASSSRETLRALFEAGVDVFRLNMSHGTHADQAERVQLIRDIEHEMQRPIGILGDLQGPKLRVGRFTAGKHRLAIGDKFRFDLEETEGDESRVYLPHPEIFAALKPGARLLVNDGKIRMIVDDCGPEFANCTVQVGGDISNNKGVNVPDVVLPLAALTDKDRADLEFVLGQGVDWLALSFVQRPEDVLEARELIGDRKVAIMVKVEKPACVERFDEIAEVSDGIMVARGDLGVEMDNADLPPIQKRLVRKCRAAAKPVVVATQMLESMIESPVPTRAEVTDVANAIYEGADCVMLSAESAAGQYPIESVAMMNQIALRVEAEELHRQIIEAAREVDRTSVADAITAAAREVAEATEVKAIACFTHSGTTASLMARERPSVPIIALTPIRETARRLCMTWGLHCEMAEPVDRFKLAVVSAVRAAKAAGFATEEEKIVVTAGVPFNVSGTTNILRVAPCNEKAIYEGSAEF
ncbi:MAG: pyruvate kinase [Pseudomonadota bacterium]